MGVGLCRRASTAEPCAHPPRLSFLIGSCLMVPSLSHPRDHSVEGSPISSTPPNETSLLAIQMEESGERRTFYVFNKPIQSSHLKLGSLTTSMVEPLADDNISMATRRNKKRIEPYQPPER